MKLTVKLDEVNYGDVAVKVMPLLSQSAGNFHGAVEKTISAIANLPENLIRSIFDAIPAEQKNEIIASFAMEHKNTILRKLNNLSGHHQLGLSLEDCSIDKELTVTAKVGEIDCICIVNRFLPAIRDKLLGMGGLVAMFRPLIQSASAEQIVGLLERFVGDNKEAFLVSLINQNQKNLISAIEDAAKKQDICLKVNSINMQE